VSDWVDVNVWVGQFPFRGIAGTTVQEVGERLGRLGFSGAVVSPVEAIFHEDSYYAEEALAHEIKAGLHALGSPWHFKVVNPTCNWWERDLRRAVDELDIAGIRLCPTFHDYRLDRCEVTDVMTAAAALRLPVQVMCKMQDWRVQWMLHTEDVEIDQVRPFLKHFREGRLILSGLHVSDTLRLADRVNACPNLLLDTSRLKGPWRTFEKLAEQVDLERLCFGSLWPINLPECPLTQLRHARLAPSAAEAILGANAARLLAGAPTP